MSIRIQYEVHPDDPEATEAARQKAYDDFLKSTLTFWGSIASVIAFVYNTVQIFKTGFNLNLLYSLAFLIGLAVIDYFYFFKKVGIIESFLKYLFFVLCGTVAVFSIVFAIMSIIYNKPIWCFIAVFVLIIIATPFLVIYFKNRPKSGKKKSLFTSQDTKEMIERQIEHTVDLKDAEFVTRRGKEHKANFINEDKHESSLYCHKCGKKVPIDSIFCNSCGTRIK